MLPIENELVIKFLYHILNDADGEEVDIYWWKDCKRLKEKDMLEYRDKIIRIKDKDYVLAHVETTEVINIYNPLEGCQDVHLYKLIKIPQTSANFFVP